MFSNDTLKSPQWASYKERTTGPFAHASISSEKRGSSSHTKGVRSDLGEC